MMKAFDGVYLIQIDVDEWGWKHASRGMKFKGIPVFFKLDAQGIPNGEQIDGGAWGPDVFENIAPVMDAFFHGE